MKPFKSTHYSKKPSPPQGMPGLLVLAAEVSLPTTDDDRRNYWLGAIGIRRDGVLVSAKNGAVFSTTTENYQLMPGSHAEGRCLRKLGKGGTIYVARVLKRTNDYAMARPCPMCMTLLCSAKIERAFYTIDSLHYGVYYPKNNRDEIFRL